MTPFLILSASCLEYLIPCVREDETMRCTIEIYHQPILMILLLSVYPSNESDFIPFHDVLVEHHAS